MAKSEGKPVKTRNEELHEIMRVNKIGRRDVAGLIGAPISPTTGQCYTLANWLSAPTSGEYRQIPVATLMLLKPQGAQLTDAQRATFEGPLDRRAIIAENRKKRACEQPGYQYADGVVKKKRVTRYPGRHEKTT